jgi:hypothetical protein
MSAQINLYNPQLALRNDRLTLAVVLQAAALVVALLAAVAVYANYRADVRQDELRALDAGMKAQRQQVDTLTAALQARKPDPGLLDSLTRARTVLATRQQLVQAFNGGAADAPLGFSESFRGLARQTVDGVWLTGFQLGADGDLVLRGRLLDQSLLPVYVRRIESEPAFQGRSFAALEMQEIEAVPALAPKALNAVAAVAALDAAKRPQPRSIEFVLRSTLAPPAGETPGARR